MKEINFDTITLPKGEGYECKVVTLCQDGIYREVQKRKTDPRRELKLAMLTKSDKQISQGEEDSKECNISEIIAQNADKLTGIETRKMNNH